MDEIRTSHRVGIPSIGLQSVRLPLIGRRGTSSAGDAMLKDLKSHMLGWYDPKRQKCTNESLTANPVLEDLSDGQYVFDFMEYTHLQNVVSSRVIKGPAFIPYNKMTHDIESFNIKVHGRTAGEILYYYKNSDGVENKIRIINDGIYTMPKCFNVAGNGTNTGFIWNGANEGITITMLPTKHPLELKNFEFGGLSGISSYGTDLTKWTVGLVPSIESIKRTSHKATVKFRNNVFNNFRLDSNFAAPIYFKAKVNVKGNIIYHDINNKAISINSNKDGIFDVAIPKARWAYFQPTGGVREYTIEILPSYPDSLVFNGTTPSWVYDKSNFRFTSAIHGEWISNSIAHIMSGTTNEGIKFLENPTIYGKKGEPLSVNIQGFKVRRLDTDNTVDIRLRYLKSNGHNSSITRVMKIRQSSTIIYNGFTETIEPYDEESTPYYSLYFTMQQEGNYNGVGNIPLDIKLEFLPNYPAPTTRNYGVIPSLKQGAKCMMMDITPLTNNGTDVESLYTQRQAKTGRNYAVVLLGDNNGSINQYLAYGYTNQYGTYINGKKNQSFKQIDLAQKRQVISVNANEINDLPNGIIIGTSETFTSENAIMALNSLILFDKELTEEEMKYVMKNLMKFKEEDNPLPALSSEAVSADFEDVTDVSEEYIGQTEDVRYFEEMEESGY